LFGTRPLLLGPSQTLLEADAETLPLRIAELHYGLAPLDAHHRAVGTLYAIAKATLGAHLKLAFSTGLRHAAMQRREHRAALIHGQLGPIR
jgi:hypothetical protein